MDRGGCNIVSLLNCVNFLLALSFLCSTCDGILRHAAFNTARLTESFVLLENKGSTVSLIGRWQYHFFVLPARQIILQTKGRVRRYNL